MAKTTSHKDLLCATDHMNLPIALLDTHQHATTCTRRSLSFCRFPDTRDNAGRAWCPPGQNFQTWCSPEQNLRDLLSTIEEGEHQYVATGEGAAAAGYAGSAVSVSCPCWCEPESCAEPAYCSYCSHMYHWQCYNQLQSRGRAHTQKSFGQTTRQLCRLKRGRQGKHQLEAEFCKHLVAEWFAGQDLPPTMCIIITYGTFKIKLNRRPLRPQTTDVDKATPRGDEAHEEAHEPRIGKPCAGPRKATIGTGKGHHMVKVIEREGIPYHHRSFKMQDTRQPVHPMKDYCACCSVVSLPLPAQTQSCPSLLGRV